MKNWFNRIIDRMSEFLAYRKGLLPFIGILFIIVNWILQFFPGIYWLRLSNSFLHLGIITALFGFLLAWAL
jgi:hypothetical protein